MNITLKGLKSFNGMDGECMTAKICFDGKVVGEVSNSGCGGPNDYTLSGKDMKPLVKAANDAGHTGSECEDLFIEDIMNDMDAEKAHKRFVKKGFKYTAYFVAADLWHDNMLVGFNDKKSIAKELANKNMKLRKIFGEEVAHA